MLAFVEYGSKLCWRSVQLGGLLIKVMVCLSSFHVVQILIKVILRQSHLVQILSVEPTPWQFSSPTHDLPPQLSILHDLFLLPTITISLNSQEFQDESHDFGQTWLRCSTLTILQNIPNNHGQQ